MLPLLTNIVHQRQTAGLSLEEACPAFVSTDTYHKHYKKYKRLADEVAQLSRLRVHGHTPRGPVASCGVSNASFEILVAGEPFHDVINARRCVGPQANDSSDFCYDHADMLGRLNAPAPPARPRGEAGPPALGDAGRALLRAAVTQSACGFAETLARDPDAALELREFLASPNVRKAKVLWQAAEPERPPVPEFPGPPRFVGPLGGLLGPLGDLVGVCWRSRWSGSQWESLESNMTGGAKMFASLGPLGNPLGARGTF